MFASWLGRLAPGRALLALLDGKLPPAFSLLYRESLENPDPLVRWQALVALDSCGLPAWLFEPYVDDPYRPIRYHAALALARRMRHHRQESEKVCRLLEEMVRSSCLWSLDALDYLSDIAPQRGELLRAEITGGNLAIPIPPQRARYTNILRAWVDSL